MRSLVWISGEDDGWACSNCQWICIAPALLSGEEAKAAFRRLAEAKFRDHKCEADGSAAKLDAAPKSDSALASRARALVKLGYTPKVAVDLVLHETQSESGNSPELMKKARAEAEDFLTRARLGLI